MSASSRAARAERNGTMRRANEISWPLPLRGLFSDAKNSEISGSLSEVMDNWRSNGVSLEMRDGYVLRNSDIALQRIAFEFGANPDYITIFPDKITFGAITMNGSFSNDFSHTSMSSNVVMADGMNPILRCDGTQIIDALITTDTGKPSSEFDGVFSHQDRLYAWDSSELDFYYGNVGEVTGQLTRFPIDRLGNISGTIIIMKAMTINAAHGMNDILVIVTSTGAIIMYEGLDPSDANDWRLLGRMKTAAPVSKFAIENFGSDLWMLTVRGVVSVKESLSNGVMALTSPIAQPVSDLIVADVKAFGSMRGWQMVARPDETDVLLNVPTATGFKQYVFTVEIKSWATSDYPARWWHDAFGRLDFTDAAGPLYRLEAGGDNGADITAKFHTSWVRLPRYTEVAYLIPTIIADGPLTVKITVLTDHDETPSDIAQSEQIITINPDQPGTGVALNETIGVNATGRVFQLRFEATGKNISFEKLIAGLV